MELQITNLKTLKEIKITLPYDTEELKEELNKIGFTLDKYEDIQDLEENDMELSKDYSLKGIFEEYEQLSDKDIPETLEELQELANFLEESTDEELDVFFTMLNDMGKCVDDAMHDVRHNNYVYYDCCSEYSLAEQYINMLGSISELPREALERYFDFEAFGKDLAMDFYKTDKGYYLEEC